MFKSILNQNIPGSFACLWNAAHLARRNTLKDMFSLFGVYCLTIHRKYSLTAKPIGASDDKWLTMGSGF